ncbi:nephrin-like [Thrips palmi]|uniref:Nephrin-like n=1 Tax=Thrips palmi TaxID=161013 RepID=A0A6P9A063_THRPL|nr:nephrin-like [Thrips palmi]
MAATASARAVALQALLPLLLPPLLLLTAPTCNAQDSSPDAVNEVPVPYSEGGTQELHALLKGQALLPCDITPEEPGDSVFLVVWYKDDLTPIYSYDVRGKHSGSPSHWKNLDVVQQRAYFRTSTEPASLALSDVEERDSGHYRCRVDFKASPTRNTKVRLVVVVPPGKPTIVDSAGHRVEGSTRPYEEGQSLELTCLVHGGRPVPTLSWWRGSQLLESMDTTAELAPFGASGPRSRKLRIASLSRRHLHEALHCQAANNNQSRPVSTSVAVDMRLRPLSTSILPTDGAPLSAHKPVQLVCQSVGSRPPVKITWLKDGKRLDNANQVETNEGNVSTSTLTFVPLQRDNNKTLKCRAENGHVFNGTQEDVMKLNVFFPPTLRLELGKGINPNDIEEGDNVYFECHVNSNPPAYKVVWKHNGVPIQGNTRAGVILITQNLAYQRISRTQAGNYSCVASNVEGDGTSNLVALNVMYKPVCVEGQKRVYGVARQERAEVLCQVAAYPPAESFRWSFNNTAETQDVPPARYSTAPTHVPGRGSATHSGSTLSYTPATELDYGTVMCWATNRAGSQAEPCVFHIIAAGKPDTPFNCTLLNQTSSALGVECVAGFDGGQPQRFELEVYEAASHRLLANVSSDLAGFTVTGLAPGLVLRMLVFGTNSKGRSEPAKLEGFTLKSAEKQTEENLLSLLGPPELTLTPVLGGVLGVDKAALPLRDDADDLPPYSDKDDRNPDLIPCNKDSDYQLGTPGQKTLTPDNGVLGGHHGVVHATLRNGDVFSKQDNREAERERYIGRQFREVRCRCLCNIGALTLDPLELEPRFEGQS